MSAGEVLPQGLRDGAEGVVGWPSTPHARGRNCLAMAAARGGAATRDRGAPPPTHQRAIGSFALELAALAGPRGAVLRSLHQRAPLRLLFPRPESDEPRLAAVLNCAGGLAGGDALEQSVRMGPGARATICTVAAEKVYRSLGQPSLVVTRLSLAPGAVLEWLPQETILFDGARLDRRTVVELDVGAVLLASEILVFGRAARGEQLRHGLLRDRWRLSDQTGRLRWADALALEGEIEAVLASPFGFARAEALGMLLLAAPGAAAALPVLRAMPDLAWGGATLPQPGLLLARWLGDAAAVRRAVAAGIVALRAAALGLPARLPRLWTT
jgi:urease accessory protein